MGLDWIGIAFTMISLTILLIYSYYIFFGAIGFLRNKSAPNSAPVKKFALLIPAYNEEKIIVDTIRNLKALDYPKNLYDIYVVTDTPQDLTGPAAEKEGAISIVRTDRGAAGKGGGVAIKFGLEEVMKRKEYDACVLIDADNLLSPNYLAKMNNELVAGEKIVQGHLRSRNPKDSWVTKTVHVDSMVRNRFHKQPRQNHKLCVFEEPGTCITRELLEKVRYDADLITADIEYTCKLACEGIAIKWIYDADVFEEKPLTFRIAIKQWQWWMLGHVAAMRRYIGKLFWRSLRNGNTVAWDCFIYLMTPIFMAIYFACFLAYTVSGSTFSLLSLFPRGMVDSTFVTLTTVINFIIGFWWVAIPLYAVRLERERVREYIYTPFTMMFMFVIQEFLFLIAVFKRGKRKTVWHTPHAVAPGTAHAEESDKALSEPLDYSGK